jgi:hypothetical protein
VLAHGVGLEPHRDACSGRRTVAHVLHELGRWTRGERVRIIDFDAICIAYEDLHSIPLREAVLAEGHRGCEVGTVAALAKEGQDAGARLIGRGARNGDAVAVGDASELGHRDGAGRELSLDDLFDAQARIGVDVTACCFTRHRVDHRADDDQFGAAEQLGIGHRNKGRGRKAANGQTQHHCKGKGVTHQSSGGLRK